MLASESKPDRLLSLRYTTVREVRLPNSLGMLPKYMHDYEYLLYMNHTYVYKYLLFVRI